MKKTLQLQYLQCGRSGWSAPQPFLTSTPEPLPHSPCLAHSTGAAAHGRQDDETTPGTFFFYIMIVIQLHPPSSLSMSKVWSYAATTSHPSSPPTTSSISPSQGYHDKHHSIVICHRHLNHLHHLHHLHLSHRHQPRPQNGFPNPPPLPLPWNANREVFPSTIPPGSTQETPPLLSRNKRGVDLFWVFVRRGEGCCLPRSFRRMVRTNGRERVVFEPTTALPPPSHSQIT